MKERHAKQIEGLFGELFEKIKSGEISNITFLLSSDYNGNYVFQFIVISELYLIYTSLKNY